MDGDEKAAIYAKAADARATAAAHVDSERERLRLDAPAWRRWGPYVSERQWGTVREDYSEGGTAWDYFPHDHARSRAYRWGEDGIGGMCDELGRFHVALALWNERDPILKERFFGLTNGEGNHGEDVKEVYYYLDATPSHSYLRMLYKYPQSEFPYGTLVRENRERGKDQPELEIYDTDAFGEDRYFDVEIEWAKADPEDLLLRITVHNRGREDAPIHVLAQLWFRNTWSFGKGECPSIAQEGEALIVEHAELGRFVVAHEADAQVLFTDNDTNVERLYGVAGAGFYKDAFHERIVHGRKDAVRVDRRGTKSALWHERAVPAGGSSVVRVRIARTARNITSSFDAIFEQRRREADAFYSSLHGAISDPDARAVSRQAFAGMIWSKQFYYYDIPDWLRGDRGNPPPPEHRKGGRNREWEHLNNADIISMPDKWEYPWYAAWDLAFHCVPLALIDPEFAKSQLVLLTREWYMHPNGQLPAYEWAFGDVNPPVHAWAAWKVYDIDRKQTGKPDRRFLERVFHKLMLNFTWWVNRKDDGGRNIFQGGFLGLDNIGVFDRSAPLPTGGHIDQADGTSWMAAYSLHLMRIALELAQENDVYEDIATKFFEHFLHIAEAMTNMGGRGYGLWDETDGFFYDALHWPDGSVQPLRVRSMVGLTPLFAVEVLEPELLERVPGFAERLTWFLNYRPDLAALVSRWNEPGRGERRLLSLLRGHRMNLLLKRLLDETEFLSSFGVRALSKYHEQSPYTFWYDGRPLTVSYQPAESESGLFGGNSNWRGPIWFPVNYMIIDSLREFDRYYGESYRLECPTGSGRMCTLSEIADELSRRLARIFLKNDEGIRPVLAQYPRFAADPHFSDHVLFYEYFHGDSGRGVGASHQTGWTGLIAALLHESGQHERR